MARLVAMARLGPLFRHAPLLLVLLASLGSIDAAEELQLVAPWQSEPGLAIISDEPAEFGEKETEPETSPLRPVAPYWVPATFPDSPVALPGDVPTNSFIDDRLRSFEEPASRLAALGRPLEPAGVEPSDPPLVSFKHFDLVQYERDAPLGFTGPSGILPTEVQQSAHFVPIEDRWRIGFPSWDRYDRGHPFEDDYPSMEGHWWDPYNQNVLKGDFPIIGQHTFLNLTATSFSVNEFRQVPTGTSPFESTRRPFQEEFFGDPDQYFYNHNMILAIDLFHGNAGFKPADWKVRLEPVFNLNLLNANELAVVYPDVRRGTRRTRSYEALEQWFFEAKLADLGPDYDFLSVRAGSQLFASDFRGFVFKDTNRGIRLFGTRFANRDQFNAIFFDQTEKNTNSELNSFADRNQNTLILNYFRQDFVFPGFTGLVSFHYNNDQPSTKFDDNGFLVRPDPAGIFREHEINSYYIGLGGDGHIGRYNIQTQFYHVFGRDSLNPIGGAKQEINAQMAAIELSYDRDWIRFRTSYFYASGDSDPNDYKAEGFETIFDDPIFAGGEFSYWQRQSLKLFNVNLVQRKSIVPNLKSSKAQGQSNFVNPGLHLFNVGMDIEVTPKMKLIANANYLWFDETAVLKTFTFQGDIAEEIGADLSLGVEYRPILSDNVIFVGGYSVLIPGGGFKDLFGQTTPFTIENAVARNIDTDAKHALFAEMVLTY